QRRLLVRESEWRVPPGNLRVIVGRAIPSARDDLLPALGRTRPWEADDVSGRWRGHGEESWLSLFDGWLRLIADQPDVLDPNPGNAFDVDLHLVADLCPTSILPATKLIRHRQRD